MINTKKLNVSPYIEDADLIINTTPIGMNNKKTKQYRITKKSYGKYNFKSRGLSTKRQPRR